jgi:peptidylprolyl isomerase
VHRILTLTFAAVSACAVIAGCGSEATQPEASKTCEIPPTSERPAAFLRPFSPPPALRREPYVKFQRQAATKLAVTDLIEGDGAEVTPGATVTVDYVAVSAQRCVVVDSTWKRQQPFTFAVGAGGVPPGWDQAVLGMRAGGRRQVFIPPALA